MPELNPNQPNQGAALAASPAILGDDDLVQPFMLESSGFRGDLARLGSVVERIVTQHAYPDPLAALLGEMLTLTALLAHRIKFDGVFSLQAKGDGAVAFMVADMTSAGDLRGYAGFDRDRLEDMLSGAGPDRGARRAPVRALLGEGYLACTVDQGPETERYQGIVALDGESLADCLQHYFRQSEQIQTGLVLAAGKVDSAWRSAGLILQRLPDPGAKSQDAEFQDPESQDGDAWRRAMILLASCSAEELLDPGLAVNDLLYRLFHQEGVRVFRRRGLAARCRCSRERLEQTLRAMPRARIEDLEVDGEVVVTCEFCNRSYAFDWAAP